MNLSGRRISRSHSLYNIYYSHCTGCRHKQCIMDQIPLLNSDLITFTMRAHTIYSLSSASWFCCEYHQAASWWLKMVKCLGYQFALRVEMCTFPLPNTLLPEVSTHLQRRKELVLNYKQVCFLPSFVLLIIPWAHTVHNKEWNNKQLSCEKTGK